MSNRVHPRDIIPFFQSYPVEDRRHLNSINHHNTEPDLNFALHQAQLRHTKLSTLALNQGVSSNPDVQEKYEKTKADLASIERKIGGIKFLKVYYGFTSKDKP